jgi:hypothetical protein
VSRLKLTEIESEEVNGVEIKRNRFATMIAEGIELYLGFAAARYD